MIIHSIGTGFGSHFEMKTFLGAIRQTSANRFEFAVAGHHRDILILILLP